MARKLKVGLTLAGSFLALIGGVIAVKVLTQPPPAPAQQVAEKLEKETPSEKTKSEKTKLEQEAKPNPQETSTKVAPPTKPEANPGINPVVLALDDTPGNHPIPKPQSIHGTAPNPLPPIDLVSPPPVNNEKSTVSAPPKELPKPLIDPSIKQVGAIELDPVPPTKPESTNPDLTESKPNKIGLNPIKELDPTKNNPDPAKSEPIKPPVPSLNDLETVPPAPKDFKISTPKNDEIKPEAPKKPIELTPTPEPIKFTPPTKEEPKDPLSFPPLPGAKQENDERKPNSLPAPLSPAKEIPKFDLGPLDAPPASKPTETGNPEPKINTPEPPVIPVNSKPTLLDSQPIRLEEKRPLPNKPAEMPTITIQAEPPPSSPITRVSETSLLDNYDEDIHSLASTERYPSTKEMYQAISKRYYENSSYSAALQLYNAERRTNNGTIRIPPIAVLSKMYPNYVPKPASQGTIQPTSATNPISVPSPANFETPSPNLVSYTVTGNGETLREIAQKKLGNPSAYRTLKQLNPSVNEDERIPAGTNLFLPAQ